MRAPIPLLLAVLVGCDLLPKELYENAGDAMVDSGGNSPFQLAETCGTGAPMIGAAGLHNVAVDLSPLADDVRGVEACTGDATPGADGFFGVEMEAGDKWHFHVRSSEGFDPAIYILDSACDARRCGPGDAIDICRDGRDEHLSFVAPSAGTFYVGVDSRLSVDATYQLVAVRPTCGDGNLEHSETCDDSNTDDGDGCDSACRVELTAGSNEEQEPNDDFTGANVLDLDGGSLSLTGRLAGPCDTDLYLVELTDPMDLRVEMLTTAGRECSPDSTPPFSLTLLNDSATSELGAGAASATNGCPILEEADLAAGIYLVSVRSNPEINVMDYSLDVSLVAP